MAAGDLSPDQARFVDTFAAATGLNRQVVVSWVGAESGWGTTKADHNYLNVGPGEAYRSTEQAASRAAALVRTSNNYAGIRAAVPVGGVAQIQAIGQSPWGTDPTSLTKVYDQLAGLPAPTTTGTPVKNVNVVTDAAGQAAKAIGGFTLGGPLGALLGVGPSITGAIKDVTGIDLVGGFLTVGLTIVFTVGAFALIALGLNRLTGSSAGERFAQIQKAVGTASTIAAVA